jgi:TPR repeat protein
VPAADYTAAADWYTRAADAGDRHAAENLSDMYAVGRGRAWQIMPACHVMPHILVPRSLT